MSQVRRFEAPCGLLAALFGFLSIAYALFGPTYTLQSSSGQTASASLFQLGIPLGAALALCIISLGFIGEAVGTVLHTRTREDRWRILLWVSWGATALIVAFLFDTFPIIAPLLLPSTLLALLVSLLSSFLA